MPLAPRQPTGTEVAWHRQWLDRAQIAATEGRGFTLQKEMSKTCCIPLKPPYRSKQVLNRIGRSRSFRRHRARAHPAARDPARLDSGPSPVVLAFKFGTGNLLLSLCASRQLLDSEL